ncbi:magnesium chelatase family protein [Prauserella isguenensis]|uniref:Magnesium chelatase family protein n=1 Tax=Prauserella isguenensis TaxID=1470180 RepID=A0A839S430_9PSEU|nr:YifB family Mg chelatase-like AAA ATPase [Prauserella isguenensis]MBB3052132.1 magnesium chelatase family protein [Prauserella isguenensis]
MPLARAWSVALIGIEGRPVEIEADIGAGLPGTKLVGLPDAGLREAKDRVRAAVRNSGQRWPDSNVTLGLSPADLPKDGSGYDLGIAVAVLAASGAVPTPKLLDTVLLGELALDGRVRPVRGVLPALLTARKAGYRRAVVALESLAEGSLVGGIDVVGAERLGELIAWLSDEGRLAEAEPERDRTPPEQSDLADVVGQPEARWALEVAAAGGHNLLMTGPPGVGKTMLATRLPGLLPELGDDEALEVTAVHSVDGSLERDSPLVRVPPFVAPHHSISVAALIGGGSGIAAPGAISKAHRGVLFLDEAAEYGGERLEALRTVLEEGEVRIARSRGSVRYPARFQLVLATNTCPCAPPRETECSCSPAARRRYLAKLSGPLLDRVDLRVRMRPATAMNVAGEQQPEPTGRVRERVVAARERAAKRWSDHGWQTNAEVPGPVLRREFALPAEATRLLDRGLNRGAITARGADRCLRIAWTLSDLEEADEPTADHVAAALEFRDRRAA